MGESAGAILEMGKRAEKIWIVAGEASGDIYGAELAKELMASRSGIEIAGMGGTRMAEAGVRIIVDSTELGIVGIVEVLKKIPFFAGLLKRMARQAVEERPDAVVLIDYPGFNIRLAERLHDAGIRVVYYISPQVWAWKKGRITKIARNVDRMLCIFPFEPKVYDGTGLDAEFIGHPLLEILRPYRERKDVERDPNLVLLLPGSRGTELKALVGTFAETATALLRRNPSLHFAMPLPRERTMALAKSLLGGMDVPKATLEAIEISVGNTRELMTKASCGLAASGTVTVEAAILRLPLVVTYRVNWLSYQLAKRLVKLPYITIANLVTGRCVYEELLQYDAVPEKLAPAVERILPGGARREEVLAGIDECVGMLGGESAVSKTAAQKVLEIAERGGER